MAKYGLRIIKRGKELHFHLVYHYHNIRHHRHSHLINYAKGLEKVSKQDLGMTENINIKIVSKEEMVLKVQSQEQTSGGMIAALFFMDTSCLQSITTTAKMICTGNDVKIEGHSYN